MNIDIDGDDQSGGYAPIVREAARRFKVLKAYGYTPTSGARARGFSRRGYSQHETFPGPTAQDFAVPPNVPEFVERARIAGLIAIPERTREEAALHGSVDWTGPHVHTQLFKRGATPLGMLRPPVRRPVQITETP